MKLNKYILILAAFIDIACCYGQKNSSESVSFSEKTVGVNLLTGDSIKAKKYQFEDRVYRVEMDTDRGLMAVQLRGLSRNEKWMDNKGEFVLYDLNSKKVKWKKKIVFEQSDISMFGKYIVQAKAQKSWLLDPETGESLWDTHNMIYHADEKNHVGLGYKFSSWTGPAMHELEGIDMRTGKSLWSRDVSRDYGWNGILHLNDSVIIVLASGLHAINLRTGKGWDYETPTGDENYTAAAIGTGLSAAAAVLTGVFVMPSGGANIVHDLVSNVIHQGGHFI